MLCLRPHHGMCIRGFVGKGYDDAFTANMQRTVDSLRSDPDQTVQLICAPDALCIACPHNLPSGCESADFVHPLDRACLDACGLREGDSLPWKEFCRRVQVNIVKPGLLQRWCKDCEWLALCLDVKKKDNWWTAGYFLW